MAKAIFILKSGHEVRVDCTDVQLKWDKQTGELTSYCIEGIKETDERPMHIVLSEIAAVIWKP